MVARHERVKETQENVAGRVAKVALDAKKLGKFSLILADPPWDDEFGASNRSIENHYPTMAFADILELPVDEVAHDQAMLFLWATPSMIEMALATAKAWGFEYRTQMVWVKPSPQCLQSSPDKSLRRRSHPRSKAKPVKNKSSCSPP